MATMMVACVTGSVLISKTSFMGRRGSDDGTNLKKGRGLEGECWRSSYERKKPGTMATAYGDGISMVLGEGRKPSGERSELY